jgi:GntR family transcriptional repressor for pyruvate dehydrogenase complex
VARSKAVLEGSPWHSIVLADDNGGERAAEEIASLIENVIIFSDIPDGERLPSERDLAVMLLSSRPTVSQAIRILVVRGLVESRRGSGAYVRRRPEASLAATVTLMLNLNQDSVSQLNQLRLWLETIGAAEAVAHATPEIIAGSKAALAALRDSAGDAAAWMSADTEFHATFVRAARNPYLASIFESVHAAVINYEYRDWIERGSLPSWLERSESDHLVELHEPMLLAMESGDAEAARVAVLEHHRVMELHLLASQAAGEPRR